MVSPQKLILILSLVLATACSSIAQQKIEFDKIEAHLKLVPAPTQSLTTNAAPFLLDSLVTESFQNPAVPYTFKTIHVYDSQDRVLKSEEYSLDPLSGSTTLYVSSKQEYTYNGNETIRIQSNSPDGNTALTPMERLTQTFEAGEETSRELEIYDFDNAEFKKFKRTIITSTGPSSIKYEVLLWDEDFSAYVPDQIINREVFEFDGFIDESMQYNDSTQEYENLNKITILQYSEVSTKLLRIESWDSDIMDWRTNLSYEYYLDQFPQYSLLKIYNTGSNTFYVSDSVAIQTNTDLTILKDTVYKYSLYSNNFEINQRNSYDYDDKRILKRENYIHSSEGFAPSYTTRYYYTDLNSSTSESSYPTIAVTHNSLASNFIKFSCESCSPKATYRVINQNGQILIQDQVEAVKTSVNIEELGSGMYYLEIKDKVQDEVFRYLGKIVVLR